ncbi:MAG: alkaline phosphatase D family protein [Porticoccaceae bacterium]
MKKNLLRFAAQGLLTFFAAGVAATEIPRSSTLAFGSCLYPTQSQPVWQAVEALDPAAFVFLGDNMYADKGPYAQQPDPQRIANAYRDLGNTPAYRDFRSNAAARGTALFAVWDDHDYGINDGGGDYPHRLVSKGYFLDFFGLEETASGGADEPGVHQSYSLTVNDLQVQLILLDTRSFRSPLKRSDDKNACPPTGMIAETDPHATVLGEAQWQWLAEELEKPADMRILASSIQVIPEQHCFEKWANFPRERTRLLQLLKDTRASGVIIISGDRHLAEISRLDAEHIGYPLYEITSSGLNSALGRIPFIAHTASKEANRHRAFANNILADNFGAIAIEGEGADAILRLQIHDANGTLLQEIPVALAGLKP